MKNWLIVLAPVLLVSVASCKRDFNEGSESQQSPQEQAESSALQDKEAQEVALRKVGEDLSELEVVSGLGSTVGALWSAAHLVEKPQLKTVALALAYLGSFLVIEGLGDHMAVDWERIESGKFGPSYIISPTTFISESSHLSSQGAKASYQTFWRIIENTKKATSSAELDEIYTARFNHYWGKKSAKDDPYFEAILGKLGSKLSEREKAQFATDFLKFHRTKPGLIKTLKDIETLLGPVVNGDKVRVGAIYAMSQVAVYNELMGLTSKTKK